MYKNFRSIKLLSHQSTALFQSSVGLPSFYLKNEVHVYIVDIKFFTLFYYATRIKT